MSETKGWPKAVRCFVPPLDLVFTEHLMFQLCFPDGHVAIKDASESRNDGWSRK